MKKIVILFSLAFVCLQADAQNLETSLKKHVTYLASDKLEGRATGSEGEMLAAQYISAEFKEIGLVPMGDEGSFLTSFRAPLGKINGEKSFLFFDDKYADAHSSYPFVMSSNGVVKAKVEYVGYGISAPALAHNDYENKNVEGKIALIQLSSPDSENPHSKFAEYTDERKKIKTAAEHGALAVIFFNTDTSYSNPSAVYNNLIQPENIPVYFTDEKTGMALKNFHREVSLSVDLQEKNTIGHNVIAFLDNGAKNTVVIGAHYDHLGHGEISGSLHRGDSAIHNGADDNASGVAVIIELAKKLKHAQLRNNNYLFVAFSGEEMGLLGSNNLVHSELMKKFTVNYMLNFDMVGRVDTSTRALIVNGVGTSPSWSAVKTIDSAGLHIKTTESGIGPSDQTSFYLQDIPVLFFFSGTHSDYHKPGDDAEKINYIGMQHVMQFAFNIIEGADDDAKLVFTKTKDENPNDTPSFKVTLGVVPDYAFEGRGMRIDGVTEGKPASKAGLLAGDIVIKLGEYEVADMMSYMKALGKFSKGEKTTVHILRNNSELSFPVEF